MFKEVVFNFVLFRKDFLLFYFSTNQSNAFLKVKVMNQRHFSSIHVFEVCIVLPHKRHNNLFVIQLNSVKAITVITNPRS